MPRKPSYPVHVLAVTETTTRLDFVTKSRVESVTAAKRLARNLGYRVCTVGGLAELVTNGGYDGETTAWLITVHEDGLLTGS